MNIHGTSTSTTYLPFGHTIWSSWMSQVVIKGPDLEEQAGPSRFFTGPNIQVLQG